MSGASRTPERRSSTENLVFSGQRRYSKAYEQPLVEHTSKGPLVRIESVDEPEGPSNQTPNCTGNLLNPESSCLGNRMAKGSVMTVALVGIVTALLGRASLLAASQLFGLVFMFTATFLVSCGLFLWWGSWGQEYINLSVQKVLGLLAMCSISDVCVRLVISYTEVRIPVAESLFLDHAGYFLLLTITLFVGFAVFMHRDGLNAMFSQEAYLFVGIVMVLNFSATCVFSQLLPSLLLSHLIYTSLFSGLTLSLLGNRYPHLSLSFVYRLLRHSDPKMFLKPGRRLSGSSMPSTNSRKVSYSSVSSMATLSSFQPSLMGGVDTDVVTEAHGIIGDLLITSNLGDLTQQKLRKVRELLAPRVSRQVSLSPRVIVGSQISQDEHDYESDTYSPRRPRHQQVHNRKTSQTLRRTSSHFTTTTSSTGMPVLESEPLDRHRSLALRDVRARISIQEKRNSVHKMTRDRLGSYGSVTPDRRAGTPTHPGSPTYLGSSLAAYSRSPVQSPSLSSRVSEAELDSSGVVTPESIPSRKSSAYRDPTAPRDSSTPVPSSSAKDNSTGMVTAVSEQVSDEMVDRQPVALSPTPRDTHTSLSLIRTGSLRDESSLSVIEESLEVLNSDLRRPRSQTLPRHIKLSPASGQLEQTGGSTSTENGNEAQEVVETTDNVSAVSEGTNDLTSERTSTRATSQVARVEAATRDSPVTMLSRGGKRNFSIFTPHKEAAPFSLEEYSGNRPEVFENVASWDFPIFELEEKAGDHILSHMSYVLFNEAGLMETFRISQREFINYFRALEVNYGTNVYHNRTHAADVLHATSYLLFEMIPEFSHEFNNAQQREWKGHQRMKTTGGNIASAFSILEVLACYMAAAMHDFDHPGRTNAFLVAIKSPLAVLYNDRSVLENHHCAASWDLLTSSTENNFLLYLSEAELKRLRFLIIEAILATDLKMHFSILSEFKAKVNPEEGEGIDWSSEVDRLLVMKMIIKMADISTPAKSYDLHRKWTTRITEEFYQQSDEETVLRLPPTIFMDRRSMAKLPAIQLSFIQNLVSPLFHACAEAGIIPGILDADPLAISRSSTPGMKEGEEQGEGEEDTGAKNRLDKEPSFEIEDEACMIGKVTGPAQKFMSIIITNLQVNYEGWQAELPQEEEPQEREQTETVATTAAKQEDGSDSHIPDSPDHHEEENPVFSGHEESTITVRHGLIIPEVKVNDESA